MEQNPFETQNKINTEIEKMKVKFGQFFDDRDELNEQINLFISQSDVFEKYGFLPNKEEVIRGLKESLNIKDREAFIAHLIKISEPIIILRLTQPKLFSKVERENIFSDESHLKLSEVLYVNKDTLNKDVDEIYIHLPSAKDFMTKENKAKFIPEIEKGLTELAKLIKNYPNIKKIKGSSWIIGTRKGPKRMGELGFTIEGPTSEEERERHFPDEERPTAKAFINREDFLARYGS